MTLAWISPSHYVKHFKIFSKNKIMNNVNNNELNSVHALPIQNFSRNLLFAQLKTLGSRFLSEVHHMEQFFIKMASIYTFTCQVIFFILSDFALNTRDPNDKSRTNKTVVLALTSILFYTIIAYFFTRIRDIFKATQSSLISNVYAPFTDLGCLLRILLEWAKAIIVVLCIKEQGVNFEPKFMYSTTTFMYYFCSEKLFSELLTETVECLHLDFFDSLEYLYIPFILHFNSLVLGTLVNLYVLIFSYSTFVLTSIYFMVFLRAKDSYWNYWKLLVNERITFGSFKIATQKDIAEKDDVCPVCLNKMSQARITPCNHMFHTNCLKQCLKSSFLCPLCKFNFKDINTGT